MSYLIFLRAAEDKEYVGVSAALPHGRAFDPPGASRAEVLFDIKYVRNPGITQKLQVSVEAFDYFDKFFAHIVYNSAAPAPPSPAKPERQTGEGEEKRKGSSIIVLYNNSAIG